MLFLLLTIGYIAAATSSNCDGVFRDQQPERIPFGNNFEIFDDSKYVGEEMRSIYNMRAFKKLMTRSEEENVASDQLRIKVLNVINPVETFQRAIKENDAIKAIKSAREMLAGMGALGIFIHHAQKVMETVALADDMDELLEDRFDDMEEQNEDQADRARYMFYHTIDATRAVLGSIETKLRVLGQNSMREYLDVPTKSKLEEIRNFCDKLTDEKYFPLPVRYQHLRHFVEDQDRFIMYSICSGMAYDYDKMSSGLSQAMENQHQRIHLFEKEFGALVCIEQGTTKYHDEIVNKFRNKEWSGHRLIVGPVVEVPMDRKIAFKTQGSINDVELKLIAEKSGPLVIQIPGPGAVFIQVVENEKQTRVHWNLGVCGQPVVEPWLMVKAVSDDFLCYAIKFEFSCRFGLF